MLRDGAAEEKALSVPATVVEEKAALLLGLDTFGERLEAERMGELDDRSDKFAGVLVVGETLDEGAVDLQHAHPGLVEPSERGVAGSEVVDRELEPSLVHVGQGGLHLPCRSPGISADSVTSIISRSSSTPAAAAAAARWAIPVAWQ